MVLLLAATSGLRAQLARSSSLVQRQSLASYCTRCASSSSSLAFALPAPRPRPTRAARTVSYAHMFPCAPRHYSSSANTAESASSTSSSDERKPLSQRRWYRLLIYTIALTPFLFILEMQVGSVGTVTGCSMSPTLNPTIQSQNGVLFADHVLLNRWVVHQGRLRRGDIVQLYNPSEPNDLLCKRIIALEGDIVRVRTSSPSHFPSESDFTRPRARPPGSPPRTKQEEDPEIIFGSIELERRPKKTKRAASAGGGGWKLFRIPEGHAWVEGDASASLASGAEGSGWSMGKSRDSREFGPVSLALITARVDYIWAPYSRIGRPGKRADLIDIGQRVDSRVGSADSQTVFARSRRGDVMMGAEAHPDDSHISPYVLDTGTGAIH
ncbi:hypothetical protein CF326_g5789 [Tilletia indica]|nr:hypothetical protein CF326_g5789 [Tilletia indica]